MPFRVLLLVWLSLAGLGICRGQGYSADSSMGSHAQQLPAYLQHAGLEQRLNQPLPMSATFTDETGHTGPLSDWFHGRPAVMALIYYKCAMLCPQVLHGLGAGLNQATLQPGKDYQVLTFSIDPTDTPADAARQKQQFLPSIGHQAPPDSVHFLVGTPDSIAAITGATGFHYVKVPGPDGRMNQFAHSSAIMFVTPDGRLSRYLTGVEFPARDLRLALLAASEHKISNPVDLLILYCCSYNPVVGKYTVSVLRILSLAGMVAVGAVIGMLVLLTRKPRAAV